MKSFVTSGTGNEQTLSEIESEKIPVYDSESDLDADLANLADGQIVATKDTGSELSAPVDTIQSGNMHAVTSNAVSKGLSYSTTEQKTGGNWIDGKPIYRRVAYSATGFTDQQVVMTLQNVDVLVNMRNLTKSNYALGNWYNDAVAGSTFLQATGEVWALRSGATLATGPSFVVVEYTKTTD